MRRALSFSSEQAIVTKINAVSQSPKKLSWQLHGRLEECSKVRHMQLLRNTLQGVSQSPGPLGKYCGYCSWTRSSGVSAMAFSMN